MHGTLDNAYFGQVALARLLLQRGMAAIYFVAFLTVIRQCKPLLGEGGLLPVPEFVRHVGWRDAPSLFLWRYSDGLLDGVGWTGLIVSFCAILGLTEAGPVWLSVGAWLVLYSLYLSIVNVGQAFFGFGWESMLLEAGFFTAFLGPAHLQPSILPLLILRWMLFRTEMGAGLIKLRHDACWRDLTCLYYHYETQPLPNPLSWYFHRLPLPLHRFSAMGSHVVQVIVPFGLFAPQPVASIAAGLIIFHQLWLIVSGNYSWLNWLTVVLGLSGLDDRVLARVLPLHLGGLTPRPIGFDGLLWMVSAGVVALSVQPVLNLLSPRQMMNYSWNRFHLVNAYGAFGNVSKERYEIVIEGTADTVISPATEWREYGFKGKPGDPRRRPPQVAPYHLRLDWMVWFLPFTVHVGEDGIRVWRHERWMVRLVQRLLRGDGGILGLMGHNPFPERPPAHIRVLFYQYWYADREQRRNGLWWRRRLRGVYLSPVSLDSMREA